MNICGVPVTLSALICAWVGFGIKRLRTPEVEMSWVWVVLPAQAKLYIMGKNKETPGDDQLKVIYWAKLSLCLACLPCYLKQTSVLNSAKFYAFVVPQYTWKFQAVCGFLPVSHSPVARRQRYSLLSPVILCLSNLGVVAQAWWT